MTMAKEMRAPRPNKNPKLLTADIEVVTESAKPADERMPADTTSETNVSPSAWRTASFGGSLWRWAR